MCRVTRNKQDKQEFRNVRKGLQAGKLDISASCWNSLYSAKRGWHSNQVTEDKHKHTLTFWNWEHLIHAIDISYLPRLTPFSCPLHPYNTSSTQCRITGSCVLSITFDRRRGCAPGLPTVLSVPGRPTFPLPW